MFKEDRVQLGFKDASSLSIESSHIRKRICLLHQKSATRNVWSEVGHVHYSDYDRSQG